MEITVLCENHISYQGARTCVAEWGLSLFITIHNQSILFDSGHSGIFWHNANQLGIDLQKTDSIVLSHRHWDHAHGVLHHRFTSKKPLVTHPVTIEKLDGADAQKLRSDFDLILSETPRQVCPNVFFLGTIPRIHAYEPGCYQADPMLDDSALAITTSNGVVVVTGCSHAGISNICSYAMQLTGRKLYGVIGGFHLFESDEDSVAGAIEFFKKHRPVHFYPMHCIDFPTLVRLYQQFSMPKYATANTIAIAD